MPSTSLRTPTLVLLLVLVGISESKSLKLHNYHLFGEFVGGKDTTIEEHPHQVSVQFVGSHICSGTIIERNVILTAAHCIYDGATSLYHIQYGSTTTNSKGSTIEVERNIPHEFYTPTAFDFDVALITLKENIEYSNIAQPIELAAQVPGVDAEIYVTGWDGPSQGDLQVAQVELIDVDVCAEQYEDVNAITENMLCGKVKSDDDVACQGDSGGPMISNGQLVGIFSFGLECREPDYPGVYSSAIQLGTWIKEHLP